MTDIYYFLHPTTHIVQKIILSGWATNTHNIDTNSTIIMTEDEKGEEMWKIIKLVLVWLGLGLISLMCEGIDP